VCLCVCYIATHSLMFAQEINVALYWDNKDMRKFVSMVPTSAITGVCTVHVWVCVGCVCAHSHTTITTGEGVADILMLMIQLMQKMMVQV
jgi:translation initiation factor IF-2